MMTDSNRIMFPSPRAASVKHAAQWLARAPLPVLRAIAKCRAHNVISAGDEYELSIFVQMARSEIAFRPIRATLEKVPGDGSF
jgi:hypothetical protein